MNRQFDSYENMDARHEPSEPDGNESVEQALLTLPLRQPSPALDRRIFSALADERNSLDRSSPDLSDPDRSDADSSPADDRTHQDTRLVFTRWLAGAAGIAACAALVTIVILNSQTGTIIEPTNDNLASGFDPVRIEHVYSEIEPEGVVFVDNDTAVQRYRRQTVEHVQLIDAKRNIRIEMTLPKEDVIVVPVSYD